MIIKLHLCCWKIPPETELQRCAWVSFSVVPSPLLIYRQMVVSKVDRKSKFPKISNSSFKSYKVCQQTC